MTVRTGEPVGGYTAQPFHFPYRLSLEQVYLRFRRLARYLASVKGGGRTSELLHKLKVHKGRYNGQPSVRTKSIIKNLAPGISNPVSGITDVQELVVSIDRPLFVRPDSDDLLSGDLSRGCRRMKPSGQTSFMTALMSLLRCSGQ